MTGFTPTTRGIIIVRADRICEVCDLHLGAQAHHRRPRGAGGTKRPESNQPANALWVCNDCHARIESQRAEALTYGWLVRQTDDPADVPVLYRGFWVWMDNLGNLHDTKPAVKEGTAHVR
ncbi:hypothetical protein A5646_03320 [Mycobacterium sp. 1245499.0]|uniref:hypothetical protein n=1 Tax=Mycobacterium sp. 1245499.0 TaxID=1834074 RepID=UPI0007FBF030|nr:hypothetical protein [Mycobacterium sp. 1245499.0]OBK92619.1 hypothetical protein A5646_03320 [Mycobacterium sp. 1245499.0]